MKKFILLFAAFIIFSSHDMFLKMETFFLEPNTKSTIQLYNGTFEKSENIITRDRMSDVSLVGNGKRTKVDTTQWTEDGEITVLNFTTGDAGTWVAGVSTKARSIELAADEFNEYLKHDGVLDMLESRKANNTLDKDANEKYSKHVKTIFQVGDKRTDDWQTVLDYPIEFVPMSNPYDAKVGDLLNVKLLRLGEPLPNQLVYVGSKHGHSHEHEHSHSAGEEHSHSHDATKFKTDENGIVSMMIDSEGHWFLRTIFMEELEGGELTHESNWATLTFEVRDGNHGHSHGDGGHSHFHFSNYLPWIGGILLLGLLLFWLRRKS